MSVPTDYSLVDWNSTRGWRFEADRCFTPRIQIEKGKSWVLCFSHSGYVDQDALINTPLDFADDSLFKAERLWEKDYMVARIQLRVLETAGEPEAKSDVCNRPDSRVVRSHDYTLNIPKNVYDSIKATIEE
ncbi:MAG: hypothetical protein J7J98_03620 [candidate division Zixibacteria bacterium]|nr:hypothetical protein [candidate division Zixibacteria bacterium]